MPNVETREDLWGYVAEVRPDIERALEKFLPLVPSPAGTRFNDAVRDALFPGGKRLRPVLTLLGAELIGGTTAAALPAAAAVEFVHSSSLIFDDLPCMDNAQKRRGQLALHRRHGEALAVLVALGLLNKTYALVFEGQGSNSRRALEAHAELVECVGTSGMVTGQTVDLSGDGDGVERPANVESIRNLKTSALIRLALRLGAILADANPSQLAVLSTFSRLIGEAYQLSDDLLDLNEDAALSIAAGGSLPRRSTSALDDGPSRTRRRVAGMVAEAKDVLAGEFGNSRPALLLAELADYIASRKA
ncbi:MAG: polyprenyl synthetase family protein [Acidobacteriota bacterium]|nr:polyprenyl synthetase family protein [Acidobacteriota bacterium]